MISMIVMLFTQSYQFLQQIVTLSIGGFFGFFMGYFGWLFAQQIMAWAQQIKTLLGGRRKKEDILKEI